ncbi:unnamed protein product [Leptidea sinapis]|uniref:Dynein intermediate chain 3, ciliary n=1 Tax=Leptidea sinapis TaxID=189913 RepID=A0A5E4PXX8_9NEOP|nr:unnamed protein product [Leptidea sinapis]
MEKSEKNDLTYEYTRRRKYFGRQTLFEDHGPELCVSIPSNPALYKHYILRNPVNVAVQNTSTMSEHWVNSVRAEYTNSGMNHVEGGWPKDINMNDPEATQRYRRKIEKDDAYIHAVMHLGHVGWWDMRKGGEPVSICPPHVAHRDLVRNVLFINSKTGAEFFSSSPDGTVKWYVFMVGTETGLVIGGNRKGKTPLEKLPTKYEAHLGPVYALQRNPTFLKNFLTVGDWTARVWSEDCRESSILWTYSHKTKLTDGAWNPIRFSLMLVTQWDGCLSCWDLLRRRSAPIVTAQLCDEPLLKLRPHEGGLLVACGSSKGTIYLAELSPNLGTADKNDKQLLTHILDRENKRERILEARMRELRLKMRQDRDGPPQVAESDPTVNDRDLEEATADYMQTVSELEGQLKPL